MVFSERKNVLCYHSLNLKKDVNPPVVSSHPPFLVYAKDITVGDIHPGLTFTLYIDINLIIKTGP